MTKRARSEEGNTVWDVETPEAMKSLASRLAPFVSPVDFIALHGDLGAGKTTFVQGFLAALGVSEAVTSPTYQLVHTHSTARHTIYHCDFYRLEPGEDEEIGLSEMSGSGVVLVEWPEVIARVLPPDRLEVRIEGEGAKRSVMLKGVGAWEKKLARFSEAEAFLDAHGWGLADCIAIRGDASARQFSRLTRDGATIMLMDWPPVADGPPIRDGRAYCEIAHLARTGASFLAVADWLRGPAGLSAPDILASDLERGLFLVEDLGDAVFGALIAQGEPLAPLYALAVDGLLALRNSTPPRALACRAASPYLIPDFDREALEVELDLLLEWYFKLFPASVASRTLSRSFFEAWSPVLDWLATQEKSLVLRDYHSPNLLVCEGREGTKRLGVIDFQDAVWGHPAYDLVSLLQDARLDVVPEIEAALFARYCEGAAKANPTFDAAAFERAYAILGAQRNTKILGIFVRLSLRDGKHGYLAHLPRIHRYLFRNLVHPDLMALRAWYEAHLGSVPNPRP